ncbi:glycosyltransferase family 2 protein [Flavobacterium sp. N502540]|uniref:glycosyltransferase family 2 protein n=1 Tax=Flavobacterium sp. N502540 TaxID=2986838 RepID=UPI0022247E77|nr:glycosyltransferase [Flavobacterium sp. N502540]
MKKKPTVSVCMITYGHENYIREAIKGVLMQECNFDIELIIANDCSLDRTDEIIREILENHPKKYTVKYFSHETNLGMMSNFTFATRQCSGKYIALCEGDDYWTDPLKLQKQVDFLESNPDYVLCFHAVNILKLDGEIVEDFITKVPENYEDIETLARLGNYIHTPSVVFRNVIIKIPFEFLLSPIGDYFLYMLLAEKGKLKYLKENMAIYRYNVGIHSTNSKLMSIKKTLNFFVCLLSYLEDEKLKNIILERQMLVVDNLEKVVREEYENYFLPKIIRKLKHIRKKVRRILQ